MSKGQEITLRPPSRLPMPAQAGVDPEQWRVLTDAIFPSARTPDAVMMALAYCRARNLDIFRRPVNIVPVWNAALGREVETVWPSINEIEVTAARSGAWAGLDAPQFGPDRKVAFRGRRKGRTGWEDDEVSLTFPEWASVTVYRIVGNQRCAFTEPVWWMEAYGRVGRTSLPNEQWARRPRGMLVKVAKAFSLRAAFPEEADYSSDEIDEIATPGPVLPEARWSPPQSRADGPPAAESNAAEQRPPEQETPADEPSPAAAQETTIDPETGEILSAGTPHELPIARADDGSHWREFSIELLSNIDKAGTIVDVQAWQAANQAALDQLASEAPKLSTKLRAAITRRISKLSAT